MGEAQGITEQNDTAPIAASESAETEAPRSHSGRGIRLLATAGAIVLGYAMWLPWAIVNLTQGDRLLDRQLLDVNTVVASGILRLGSAEHPLLTISQMTVVLGVFTMLGVLLAPLLWRPADSLLGAIATHIFGLWVIFATAIVILINFLTPAELSRVLGINGVEALFTLSLDRTLGYWLAVLALVALWIAVIGLLAGEWRRHAFWHLPGADNETPRSLIQIPGAGILNLGLIVWAIGFLIMGWASLNCTQAPLLVGSCQGIPASEGLFAQIAQASNSITLQGVTDPQMLVYLDPNIARYALPILLGVGAAMIFLGVWMRAVTRVFCVWTALWLILAVALVGLAYAGIGYIVGHPTRVGLAAGGWSVESGVWITLLGLIFAIIGLATLIAAALRPKAE